MIWFCSLEIPNQTHRALFNSALTTPDRSFFLSCSSFTILLQLQHLKQETETMMKKIEQLKISKRKLLGEDSCSCSVKELEEIEQQLESSARKVRERKSQVYNEQMEQLKEKAKNLAAENARLSEKYNSLAKQAREKNDGENAASLESSPTSEVETDLFIGLPETRGFTLPLHVL